MPRAQPALASPTAMPRPMPLLAPVTSAHFRLMVRCRTALRRRNSRPPSNQHAQRVEASWQLDPHASLVGGLDRTMYELHPTQTVIDARKMILCGFHGMTFDIPADGFGDPAVDRGEGGINAQ